MDWHYRFFDIWQLLQYLYVIIAAPFIVYEGFERYGGIYESEHEQIRRELEEAGGCGICTRACCICPMQLIVNFTYLAQYVAVGQFIHMGQVYQGLASLALCCCGCMPAVACCMRIYTVKFSDPFNPEPLWQTCLFSIAWQCSLEQCRRELAWKPEGEA